MRTTPFSANAFALEMIAGKENAAIVNWSTTSLLLAPHSSSTSKLTKIKNT